MKTQVLLPQFGRLAVYLPDWTMDDSEMMDYQTEFQWDYRGDHFEYKKTDQGDSIFYFPEASWKSGIKTFMTFFNLLKRREKLTDSQLWIPDTKICSLTDAVATLQEHLSLNQNELEQLQEEEGDYFNHFEEVSEDELHTVTGITPEELTNMTLSTEAEHFLANQ